MSRRLSWGLGLLLIAGLVLGAFFVLPFRSWLPGGTVADVPNRLVVNGTALNRLFPAPEAGEKLVFTQEKRGFSQARLKQGDAVRALLSISDVTTSPASRAKFGSSGSALAGWPLVEQGDQSSALLVADRFQVKVIGQGAGLSLDERHELLGAFNLQALAALNPGSVQKALPQAQAQAPSVAAQSPAARPSLAAPSPAARVSATTSPTPGSPTQPSANRLAALQAARAAAHRQTAVQTPAA
jgi:hypothetical protein